MTEPFRCAMCHLDLHCGGLNHPPCECPCRLTDPPPKQPTKKSA